MEIRPDALVSDIASAMPASIKVFQRYRIEFCCGGRIPLSEACAASSLSLDAVLADLASAQSSDDTGADWREQPLASLIAHIQHRYHVPLRDELPRLSAMMDKVASKHGLRLEYLLELRATFEALKSELLEHMNKEDAVLFPAILALETGGDDPRSPRWGWISQPIDVMEAEHDSAGAALARMRELTGGYTPPEGACPTFRGLYFGLSQLESDMHQHVHLENHVLFPRAEALAHGRAAEASTA